MKKRNLFLWLLLTTLFSCNVSNEDISLKIIHGEKIEAEEKTQFVKFINSDEGKKWLSNLKHRVNTEIKDELKRRRALSNLSEIETTALEWKKSN